MLICSTRMQLAKWGKNYKINNLILKITAKMMEGYLQIKESVSID